MVNILQILAFYGNKANYIPQDGAGDELGLLAGKTSVDIDQGKRARDALSLLNSGSENITGLRPTRAEDYFTAVWEGRGFGKNEKMIRTKKPKSGGFFIRRNQDYDKFIQALSDFFKINGKVIDGFSRVIMKISCHHSRDHHNFIEPVMDALQSSGCVHNDREVIELILPEPERHGNGVNDIISVTPSSIRSGDSFFTLLTFLETL